LAAAFLGGLLTKARGARTQAELADAAGINRQQYNAYETGKRVPPDSVLEAVGKVLGYKPLELLQQACQVEATEVAAEVRPVIRPLGAGLQEPPEGFADDYLAVPLVEGRAAAGPGGVVWEQVKSLVWVYGPELGNRRRLVALQVGGSSMEPTIPDGAIVIVDKADWRPNGDRRNIWALRTEDGDTQVKRLKSTKKGMILISDNFNEYPPDVAWTGDMKRLIIGKVIWMWRALG